MVHRTSIFDARGLFFGGVGACCSWRRALSRRDPGRWPIPGGGGVGLCPVHGCWSPWHQGTYFVAWFVRPCRPFGVRGPAWRTVRAKDTRLTGQGAVSLVESAWSGATGQVFRWERAGVCAPVGLHGRGKWLSTSYVPGRSVGPFRGGRSQASALGCSLGERPNNAHIILSVTPNLFWGKWWSGVIDGGGQAMGRTVWKVEGFPENCGFVHHEANTIQDFSCSLVARGDVGPLMAPRTHQPLGFLGTTRTRWCCFRTKVLVFPDTPPLLPSGCPPTGSTPWKRPTEAPPSRFGPAKNKAAGQPLIAFCSACHPSPLQTN